MSLLLDAHSMTVWQACRRRYELETGYRPVRWRPKSRFDALLRRAIFLLSSGADHATLASDAKTTFLQSAANPGLDLPSGANPYLLARSWCGMFDTVLAAIARTPLLVMKELPPLHLSTWLDWQPRAWADESGQLHRWLTVDSWDEDQLSRELHGWRTIGDIAATGQPMQIHVIEIGRATKEGRSSPWSRAWRHPSIASLRYRFRKDTGGELAGSWTPIYYNENEHDAEEWVGRLIDEGEFTRNVHHLLVQAGTERQNAEVVRQVMLEALEIREIAEEARLWHTLPMSRAACDGWIPCPFQPVCYSPEVIAPDSLPLFQLRARGTMTVKEA